ncbi:carbohydrate kinase family protein [Actinomadura alba]|uniref:Carbohydrate kinase n=1 Tax=Actinomadura alba TaxID=406431 RepID=A0ABR7LV11_9ACTN|nr:carbohydrate kinase [Actinomadura alba]MBC6468295.1 carbohydrate kinase [Actinomadura alba]
MSEIAVIGEAVADAFPASPGGPGVLELHVRPGGSPVNTAVALSRLGTPTRFLGRLAAGPLGDLVRAHLAGSRVDISGCVDAAEPATLAIAKVDQGGQASYEFYADGTADWQWTTGELSARTPWGVSCTHAGSLALVRAPGGPLIEELLERMRAHSTISIDPNLRPHLVDPAACRARLDRWTGLADVFRLSDEDFGLLCPGATPDEAFDEWHAKGVGLVVITRGSDGAVASLRGTRIAVPAVRIEPVDTVGAGDAFTAGLLHSLRRQGHLGGRLTDVSADDVRAAMGFAVRVAALTCEVPGADPPWGDSLASAGDRS